MLSSKVIHFVASKYQEYEAVLFESANQPVTLFVNLI